MQARREGRAAVLLMAYGAPTTLDEVEPFLRDIRHGRPTTPQLVEEIRGRYAAIGGGSPLLARSLEQARALEQALAEDGRAPLPVVVGMRHSAPRIRTAVTQLLDEGIERLIAICLAPHYSGPSVGAYRRALEEALEESGAEVQLAFVERWGDHPRLVSALAGRIGEAAERARSDGADPSRLHLLLTAHSLPLELLQPDDPYESELRETARRVAERLGHLRWRLVFQSVGARPGPWLGPALPEVLEELAATGSPGVLVAPIGFVSDHVETLYDLDVEARRHAEDLDLPFWRAAAANDHPELIAALADLVHAATP